MSEPRGTGRGRSALRIGAAIALLPLVTVLLATILFGEPPSILGLIVASAGVLVTGLLVRQSGGRTGRRIGGVLAGIGAISLASLAALAVVSPRGY